MNKNFSLKFKIIDIFVIIISLVASVGFMTGIIIYNNSKKESSERYVNVYHQNVLLEKYTIRLDTLDEEKTIVLTKEEYPKLLADFTIVINKKKGIKVEDVTCPDHTCEKQGWVNITNLPIICIPNDVRVVIVSSKSGGDDVIGGCNYETIKDY